MKRSKGNAAQRGSVRIIGGRWRGRRIALPEHGNVRPTPDRVRETLFNWLTPVLPGAVCLDLYAGSGVLGFEALSRGAGRAVLVERGRAQAAALERFRETLAGKRGMSSVPAEIVTAEALEYLARPAVGPFDIAFVDPPYAEPVLPVLSLLAPRLKPGARVYLERARGDAWPELDALDWVRTANAAGVAFGLAEIRRQNPIPDARS